MAITAIRTLASVPGQGIQNGGHGALPIQNLAMTAIGLVSLAFSFLPTVAASSIPNCLTTNCPDLDEAKLHPGEKAVLAAIYSDRWFNPSFKESQEFLRLRGDDPNEKMLFLSAADTPLADFSSSTARFSGARELRYYSQHPSYKNKDLRFALIESFNDLCNEVKEATKAGRLTHVFIHAMNQSDNRLKLSCKNGKCEYLHENLDFQSCFTGLHSTESKRLHFREGSRERHPASIEISSDAPSKATNNLYNRLIQKIANQTNMEVAMTWAPTRDSFGFYLRTFYPGCDATVQSVSKNPNWICPPYADLDEKKLHPHEKTVMQELANGMTFEQAQEYLRLHRGDPRPKLLFLVADDGTVRPSADLLKSASSAFDLKYMKVRSKQEICHEVKDAAKVGKLSIVIINGHGAQETLQISPGNAFTRDQDYASCFSGLEPSGKIILHSCYVGAPQQNDSLDNLAQTIADKAKIPVIAAKSSTVFNNYYDYEHTKISSLDPFMISHTSDFHPTKDLVGLNIYRTFIPRYKNCPTVQPNKLHDREMLAIDAINDDLKQKNLETFTPIWERSQDYVRLCAEDPKNKLLFLSAGHDPFGLAHPKINPSFLSSLNDKFDFQYKLISSYKEMCKVIDAASKIGNLFHVIIEGQGILSSDKMTSKGLVLWRKEDVFDSSNPVNEELFTLKNTDIKSCFSGLNPSGSVVLLSDFAGGPRKDFQQSFAQKLSDVINQVIIAPISVSPQVRSIPSFDPFEIFTPSENDAKQNNFREFRPMRNP
jgi:hypothetical protein